MMTPRLILNNVSFQRASTCFKQVNCTFGQEKVGIVGANGVGKTTLLQLLLGELKLHSGSLQRRGQLMLVPQSHTCFSEQATISEVLGVATILEAITRINTGGVASRDFDRVGDHWDIESRMIKALQHFNLWPLDINRHFSSLSGGQKTKVLLAKTKIFSADFLLFDEPTNNLDQQTRALLYTFIEHCDEGVIIVSHDRKLLNQMDKTIEITSKGLEVYGGNYDFYKEQKQIKLQAYQQELQARTQSLIQSKKVIQVRMERHQQNEARGRKGKIAQIKAKGSYDKITFKSQQARSEKTNRKVRLQASRKLDALHEKLNEAHSKLEYDENLNVNLAATRVPNNKIVLKIEDVCFSYNEQSCLLDHFNLALTGSNRIAIIGSNGCGKTTLIKLIRGDLVAKSGSIMVGVDQISYLDQSVSFLDPTLTLLDNFLQLNPTSKSFDAYRALASFKFRNTDAEKVIGTLSGGERMRAGLAISLLSQHPPQLIILDEPTNHLDLDSIAAIEKALQHYQGAILAVSHDEVFLGNINITRTINLDDKH